MSIKPFSIGPDPWSNPFRLSTTPGVEFKPALKLEDWQNVLLEYSNALLPSYDDMYNYYPKDAAGGDMPADEVYKLVGGQIYKMYLEKPQDFANACALRVSYALNKSGVDIPAGKKTFKGEDKKNYFLGAIHLHNWMKSYFGDPDITAIKNFESELQGNKGIYTMIPKKPGKFGASGHATLFDGSECIGGIDHCYLTAEGGVEEIHLWILK